MQGVFDAMQMGPAGEGKMMALFADDAVFTEPFSGEGRPTTHTGKEAIRQSFLAMWSGDGPHDLQLSIDRLDVEGNDVRVEWTCRSASFKTPMQGYDLFDIRDGLIKGLEFNVVTWPEMDGH